jgi:hypothetical protein
MCTFLKKETPLCRRRIRKNAKHDKLESDEEENDHEECELRIRSVVIQDHPDRSCHGEEKRNESEKEKFPERTKEKEGLENRAAGSKDVMAQRSHKLALAMETWQKRDGDIDDGKPERMSLYKHFVGVGMPTRDLERTTAFDGEQPKSGGGISNRYCGKEAE